MVDAWRATATRCTFTEFGVVFPLQRGHTEREDTDSIPYERLTSKTRSVMARVREIIQFYLSPIRISSVGISHNHLFSQLQSITALWLGLISGPRQQLDRFTHFRTTTPQIPHWYTIGRPHSPSKLSLPVGVISTQFTCLILGLSRPTTPNGIHTQSAVFPQSTGQTDRQTDTHPQTDRWPRRQNLYQYPLTLY